MSATLSGPSTGNQYQVLTYTVSQSALSSDITTYSDNNAGGIFEPRQLLWSGTNQNQTFNYIPNKTGSITLTITDSSGNTVSGSPLFLTVSLQPATSVQFSGPSPSSDGYIAATVGVATGNFTVTPNGLFTGVVFLSDGNQSGTFNPSSLTFSNSSTPQTFTYTPAVASVINISLILPSGFSPVEQIGVNPMPAAATTATLSWTPPLASGPNGTGPTWLQIVQAGRQVPTPFTISLNGAYEGVITLSDGSTGTFWPSNKLIYPNESNSPQQFWYTPPISLISGSVTISISASPSLTISGNDITVNYVPSTPFTNFAPGVHNPFYSGNPTNS
jgi:hypothetical protein